MSDNLKLTIKSARINRKLTQEQASAKIGVTATTLSHWETGKTHPTLEDARRLSEEYDYPIDMLIF